MSGQLKPEHNDIVNDYLESVKNHKMDSYMLTIARDGEDPVRSIIFFPNAIEAAEAYNIYNDWGFARNFLTVRLYEPTGKIHEKVFKRNQAGDPTFLRQNYVEVTEVLKELKPHIDEEVYKNACIRVATTFAKDNWRFDAERFLANLDVDFKILN